MAVERLEGYSGLWLTPEGVPILHAVAFDLVQFRARLRAEREARVGGRDRLAKTSGLAKSTIQNAEVGPDIPGIDTVARLIDAMPGLTLGSFFTEFERSRNGLLNPLSTPAHNPSQVETDAAALSDQAIAIEVLIGGLADTIERAAERVASSFEQSAGARVSKPARRQTPHSRRRKAS